MTDGTERAPADIRILGGRPSAEELAAVTAVLSASLDALAKEHRRKDAGDRGWDRARRAPNRGVRGGGWATFGR